MGGAIGGIAGGLLGGGKKSGGGGSSTTTAYQLLPKNIRDAVDSYFSKATNLSNQPYTPYTGEQIAPLSGTENQAIDYAKQNFGSTLPVIQNANAVNQQLLNTASQGPTLQNLQQYMSPYQQAVTDQAKRETIRDFEGGQLQQIGRDAANSGAFGGSRQALMESEAYRNLNQGLTDIQERGNQNAFTNAQQQYFNTLNTASDINKNAVQTGLYGQQAVQNDVAQLMQLGQQQRGITQAGLDTDYQNFQNQQNYPINALNILGGALSNTSPYFSPYSTQQQGGGSSQGGSTGSNLLSAGLQMAPMLFSMFSDERVKENEKIVGELDNGLPVYKYNYKGDPRTQIGVMAQDVEKSNPNAVTETQDGIKMVNYDQATEKFACGGHVKGFASGGFADLFAGLPSNLSSLLGIGQSSPGIAGGTIQWDDGTTSETKGTPQESDLSTKGLSKIFSDAADEKALMDKTNNAVLNQVGDRLSKVRFVDLTSPYAQEQAQATAFANSGRQQLFNYASGGLITRNAKPFADYVGTSYDMVQKGKKDLLDATLGKTLDFLFAPTDEMVAARDARKQKAKVETPTSMVDKVSQAQDLPLPEVLSNLPDVGLGSTAGAQLPPMPANEADLATGFAPASLPQVAGITDKVQTAPSSSNVSSTDAFALEQMVPKQQPGISSEIGEFSQILQQLGLQPQTRDVPMRQGNPLLAGLAASLANSGELSTQQLRSLAATYATQEGNEEAIDKVPEKNRKDTLEAYDTAGKLMEQINKKRYNDAMREQIAQSGVNTQLLTQAKLAVLNDKTNTNKPMSEAQKFQLQIALMNALSNPTLEDDQKLQYNNILTQIAGGGLQALPQNPGLKKFNPATGKVE
jgi:hypothetical protein